MRGGVWPDRPRNTMTRMAESGVGKRSFGGRSGHLGVGDGVLVPHVDVLDVELEVVEDGSEPGAGRGGKG